MRPLSCSNASSIYISKNKTITRSSTSSSHLTETPWLIRPSNSYSISIADITQIVIILKKSVSQSDRSSLISRCRWWPFRVRYHAQLITHPSRVVFMYTRQDPLAICPLILGKQTPCRGSIIWWRWHLQEIFIYYLRQRRRRNRWRTRDHLHLLPFKIQTIPLLQPHRHS